MISGLIIAVIISDKNNIYLNKKKHKKGMQILPDNDNFSTFHF